MAFYALEVAGASDKPTDAASAKELAWALLHAHRSYSEAEAVIAAVAEHALQEAKGKDVSLLLDFDSLVTACRDPILAEVAALGAGFWGRSFLGEWLWCDEKVVSRKRATLSFAGRWWSRDELMFLPSEGRPELLIRQDESCIVQ